MTGKDYVTVKTEDGRTVRMRRSTVRRRVDDDGSDRDETEKDEGGTDGS